MNSRSLDSVGVFADQRESLPALRLLGSSVVTFHVKYTCLHMVPSKCISWCPDFRFITRSEKVFLARGGPLESVTGKKAGIVADRVTRFRKFKSLYAMSHFTQQGGSLQPTHSSLLLMTLSSIMALVLDLRSK